MNKNQIAMDELILNNNKKEVIPTEMDMQINLHIQNIHISTFKLINKFLEEIKMSTKSDSLFRTTAIKNTGFRYAKYHARYKHYFTQVIDSDKSIFAKLVNYITAEGGNRNGYSEYASNMPMCIDYSISYKSKVLKGVYREDRYYCESNLMYRLSKMILKEFNEEGTLNSQFKALESMKMEIYSSYDILFNLNDEEALEEQILSILDSPHFKNWKFKGERTESEREILSYIFDAKREVMSHKGRGQILYNGINIDTCRYVACLIGFVKHGKFSRVKDLNEKIELYNKIYPFFLEEISKDNKDIFSKMANFLTFENEKYSITGYNGFSNTSKEAISNRLNLFNKAKVICEGKPKKKMEAPEIKINYPKFMHAFTGGSAIHNDVEGDKTRLDIIKELVHEKTFIEWEFTGLKTEKESFKELTTDDKFKEINFSENSYYLLGYTVNNINKEETCEKRCAKKEEITNKILELIPTSEHSTFNTMLKYLTSEDENGFNVNAPFMDMETKIIRKSDGRILGRLYSRNINQYSQVSKESILNEINEIYSDFKKTLTEDNFSDLVELRYRAVINILPKTLEGVDTYTNFEKRINMFKHILNKGKVNEGYIDSGDRDIKISDKISDSKNDLLEKIDKNSKGEIKTNTPKQEEFKVTIATIEDVREKSGGKNSPINGQLAFAF